MAEAEKVKITGAAGAYTAAFENMESQIAEVNQIIDRSSLEDEELIEFRDQITSIEKGLEDTVGRMRSLDNSLTSTEQAIYVVQPAAGAAEVPKGFMGKFAYTAAADWDPTDAVKLWDDYIPSLASAR